MESQNSLEENYATAVRLIDEAHAGDPRTIPSPEGGSSTVPYELHYAQKMSRWLALRCPDPSPALQLACRAQHFRRLVWLSRKIPFPPLPPPSLLILPEERRSVCD